MKAFGLFSATGLIAAIALIVILLVILYMALNLLILAPPLQTTSIATIPTSTIPTFGNSTIVVQNSSSNNLSQEQTVLYALRQINTERSQFGLQNVTLSNVTSGQQHANSMLYYNYFSHWDPFGMKPYMRYTLLGGAQGVDENVAYNEQVNQSCLGPICSIQQINVTAAIGRMDYQMLYNDSLCCNNGHKNNTLDPNHNQVSLGIAYNKTSVYLVEDFIDNYTRWLNGTPGITSGGIVYLNGDVLHKANFSYVQVNFDPTPMNMTNSQLSQTKSYDGGEAIGAIAYGPEYYKNLQTVYASSYIVKKSYFDVAFNLSTLTKSYGAGVYTLDIFLTNSSGDQFLGTTYSIFINSSKKPYTPGFV